MDNTRHTAFDERVTRAYLFFMIVGYLLFTGAQGYNDLSTTKFIYFAGCTLLWILVLLCGLSTKKVQVTMGQQDLWILLFLLACGLSTALSPQASFLSLDTGRYDGLFTWLMYGLILWGISHFSKVKMCYLITFAVSYSICCIVAILQLMGKNPLWLYLGTWNYYSPFIQETGAFLGTLGNVDVFSALHCLAIPIFLAACIFLKKKSRFFLLIPVILGLFCVIGAKVASGVLALGTTILICMPQWIDHYLTSSVTVVQRTKIRRIICSILGLAVVLFLLVVYLVPYGSGTLYEFHCVLHGEVQDHFGSHRIQIWKKAVGIIKENLVVGIGPDCSLEYFDICFSRYSDVFEETIYAYVDNAHNEYLQILINFGLVGFLPLSILMCKTLWGIHKNQNCKSVMIMTPGLLCYLIQAFFNIGSFIVAPFFWITWGMILHEIRLAE